MSRDDEGTTGDDGETATVVLIAVVTGIVFRSVGAPIVALGTAGLAYALDVKILGWLAERGWVSTPGELEPLIVVLLVGVVTDYAIFYLSTFRAALRSGASSTEAARRSASLNTPIITAAGLLVAAGTAILTVADLSLFAGLGPGMAITVLLALVLAATFMPAALALLGRLALWPGERWTARAEATDGDDRTHWRRRLSRMAMRRPVAAGIILASIIALAIAAAPARRLSLGVDLVGGLPPDAQARQAAAAARQGFVPGIIAPTELLLTGPGVTGETAALGALKARLEDRPGVAAVIAPTDLPVVEGIGLLRARDGSAARYVILLDDDPAGAAAIATVDDLADDLPEILEEVGLGGRAASLAGDTAVGAALVGIVWSDALRIAIVTALADLVLLGLFLRSAILPFVVVALSGLVLVTALGLVSWFYQGVLGVDGLTFYVPVAVGVLLISFGSDYNVFLIGNIWEHADHQPFDDAVVEGGAEASSAVPSAGLILAMSFGLLAIIPLNAFRQFAMAMVIGVLVDSFLVRSFVMQAILALLGPASAWPARRLRGSARVADRVPVP